MNTEAYSHTKAQHLHTQRHHNHSHAQNSQHSGGHHLLQIENLSLGFRMYDPEARGFFQAPHIKQKLIDTLSLSVHVGEILALVGASGSGKTLLADSLMALFEPNVEVCGSIYFDGVLQDAASLAKLRGNGISFVPQSTMHLDPLMRVGKQVCGFSGDRRAREKKRKKLFERYELDESLAKLYPFELSGGMARRVLLVSALMDEPRLIIADEPTPGLDLELAVKAMDDFRKFADEGRGVLLITHDIELALKVADRIAVFSAGSVVEETAVHNFSSPDLLNHPFSKKLWHALPEHDFLVLEDQNASEEGTLC